MKEFAVYSVLRIGLFIACFGIFIGLWAMISGADEVNWILPFIAAFIVSGGLSYKLLQGPRSKFAMRVQERAKRASAKMEEIRAKEDAD